MSLRLAHVTTGFTGILVASCFAISPVRAQNLPSWQPRNICSSDSAQGQCLLFEQRAANNVTASWSLLPASVRSTCLARFEPPLEPSWRVLGDCIEIEGRAAQQVRATALKKREDAALVRLGEDTNRRRETVQRQRRLAAQEADDQKRIADEEASFMARLAEQRSADKLAASAKASAAAALKAERRRIAAEEASFTSLLAEQRRDDAARQQKSATSKSKTTSDKAAKAKRAAEAERQRVATEEASFMAQLAIQRRIDAEAAKRKTAAKKQVRAKAAQSCQVRLKQIQSSGVIRFALNSADIASSKSTALLDKLAKAATHCEGQLSISVEGHTDSLGRAAANNRLSQARAQTVANYLHSKGIAKDRISARGFGSSKPIASNRTSAGRAKNRRIEFNVK